MIQIETPTDCDNSPKKKFIKDFNIAFATADIEFLSRSVSEDIHWDIIGDKLISGKEDFITAVSEMADYKASKLVIHQVLTHGKEAASNGYMNLENEPNIQYAFCDFYELVSAGKNIIKKMRSYVIKVS